MMKNITPIMLLASLLSLGACNLTEKELQDNDHSISSPEAQGMSSRSILEFVEALENELPDAIHSLMLRRHGRVVAQGWWAPYNPESPHMLYSLSKSFTSSAIGIAQDEGLISIDDPVISFFPDETPEEPGDNLKAMRIRDLLKMSSGHQWGTSGGMRQAESWVEGFLAQEVQHKPGTHFVYNSGATYMLSAIIQKVTGMTLLDYLKPRLFNPLGIENPTWESDPDGINTGGWGLSVTTEDISKFGQLYLQKGMWEGKQLISEAWIEEATRMQSSNGSDPDSDWEQGYGYQFWRCRHGIYRGDGAFGQFCIVMPEQDAVLAITSGTNDLQGVLNIVWEHLLPAFEEDALSPDEEGLDLLNTKLQGLAIRPVEGEEGSPDASSISDKTYDIVSDSPSVTAVSFDFEASPPEITLTTEEGEQTFKAGYNSWEKGSLVNPRLISKEIAASGAWETPGTYVMTMIYYETPYCTTHTFKFDENSLLWDTELNVSFDSKGEQLKGIAGS
jgi:CubicO group peptidase (beta-lactamase class C family)